MIVAFSTLLIHLASCSRTKIHNWLKKVLHIENLWKPRITVRYQINILSNECARVHFVFVKWILVQQMPDCRRGLRNKGLNNSSNPTKTFNTLYVHVIKRLLESLWKKDKQASIFEFLYIVCLLEQCKHTVSNYTQMWKMLISGWKL